MEWAGQENFGACRVRGSSPHPHPTIHTYLPSPPPIPSQVHCRYSLQMSLSFPCPNPNLPLKTSCRCPPPLPFGKSQKRLFTVALEKNPLDVPPFLFENSAEGKGGTSSVKYPDLFHFSFESIVTHFRNICIDQMHILKMFF